MKHESGAGDSFSTGLIANQSPTEALDAPHIEYRVDCIAADGSLKWSETFHNLVTRAGAADLLDKYFSAGTNPATWYLGLISNTSWSAVAKTDTASSHSGWTESAVYSNSTRPSLAWSSATTASDNVDKVASAAASFTINGSDTIKGCFVISNSTISGTSGVLYSAGTFTDRAVVSGDTLNVTPTLRLAV